MYTSLDHSVTWRLVKVTGSLSMATVGRPIWLKHILSQHTGVVYYKKGRRSISHRWILITATPTTRLVFARMNIVPEVYGSIVLPIRLVKHHCLRKGCHLCILVTQMKKMLAKKCLIDLIDSCFISMKKRDMNPFCPFLIRLAVSSSWGKDMHSLVSRLKDIYSRARPSLLGDRILHNTIPTKTHSIVISHQIIVWFPMIQKQERTAVCHHIFLPAIQG